MTGWGEIHWGLRPEGFNGWAYISRPGTLTIPWCKTPGGDVLIGIIREHRPNIGNVWGVPGGAVDMGETPNQAASREATEEGGIDASEAKKLPGADIIPDRMLCLQEKGKEWGIQAYGLEIPFESIEHLINDEWRLKDGVISRKGECEIVFLPWKKATSLCSDGLALAGILRLLSEII